MASAIDHDIEDKENAGGEDFLEEDLDEHSAHRVPPFADSMLSVDALQEPGDLPPVLRHQVFAAFAAALSGMVFGAAVGWSSPALTRLEDPAENSEFPITESDKGWIGSILALGAMIGGPVSGYLTERFGRKGTLYLITISFVTGFLLLVSANGVAMLIIGRLICGLSIGMTTWACPTYVAEVASPHVRGLLVSGFQLMVTVGVLYVDVTGSLMGWRWISVSCIAVVLLWSFLMLFIPETPAYLLTRKKYDAARASMEQLRGHHRIVNELTSIQESLEKSATRQASFADLIKPENLKPLLLTLIIMFGQQTSGINAVLFYSVSIFESAKTPLNSYVENIIIGVAQVLGTAVATFVIDRLGRRILLLVSGSAMVLSLSGMGAYFYIQSVDAELASKLGFLPIICLCVFIIAFSLGFGPIPWLIMSELLAPEVKAMSGSIAGFFNWTMAFLITRFFGDLNSAIGAGPTFWVFAGATIFVTICVFFLLPETKGKSLEEIQELFSSPSSSIQSDERDCVRIVGNDILDEEHNNVGPLSQDPVS